MLIFAAGLVLFTQDPVVVSSERLSVLEACADRSDLMSECPAVESEAILVASCSENAATVGGIVDCVTQRMTDCMDTDDDGSVELTHLARWCGARVRAGLSNVLAKQYQLYSDSLPAEQRDEFRSRFSHATAQIAEHAAASSGDPFQVGSVRTGRLAQLTFSLIAANRVEQ